MVASLGIVAATTLPALADVSSGAGRAGEDRTAWWLEARPWTCVEWTAPLARELQLACEAVNGCRVASEERRADRRAVLSCEGDDWRVVAQSSSARELWSLQLEGTKEERLRQAAAWIARSERGGSPPLPARASDPVVVPLPAAPVTPVAPVAPVAPDADRPWTPAPAVEGPHSIGLAVTGLAAVAPDSHAGPFVGGRVVVSLPVTHAHLGLVLSGFDSVETRDAQTRVMMGRAGLSVGWGAPWTGDVFGFAVGAGGGAASARDSGCVSSCRRLAGLYYGEASVFAQWPRASGIRPILALSISGMPQMDYVPQVFTGVDLGFAWND